MNVDNHFEKLMGPYAYGGPIISGNFKTCVDDFWVTEQLGFEPCGEGEHVYCYIEKQSVNTEQVASRLAIHASVPRKQVNYAGLKDKQGITKQWFSVHMPGKVTPDFSEINGDNIKVLLQKRHLKKLQRGVLTGNQFQVRLRNINGDISLLEQRLKVLKQGFPNYFGAQRFGYQGQNLEKAKGLFFENKNGIVLLTLLTLLNSSILVFTIRSTSSTFTVLLYLPSMGFTIKSWILFINTASHIQQILPC